MHSDRVVYLEEWVALLSISTRFDFEKIRSRAIDEIDSDRHTFYAERNLNYRQRRWELDPITKIALAMKHDVPEWLAPAYEQLCRRIKPLDEQEGEKLGMKIVTMVMRAREAVREQHSDGRRSPIGFAPVWPTGPPVPPSPSPPPPPEYHSYSHQMVSRVVQEVFFPKPPSKPSNSSV
jgi:hypothetical protein